MLVLSCVYIGDITKEPEAEKRMEIILGKIII